MLLRLSSNSVQGDFSQFLEDRMFPNAIMLRVGIVLAVLFSLATFGHAQFSGNVEGTVTDSTGAVVPGVAITLHNTGTGVDLHETTNGAGFYRFSAIAPGDY